MAIRCYLLINMAMNFLPLALWVEYFLKELLNSVWGDDMEVKIGHALRDENNKLKNGKAGDQTGKEVLISNWYLHSKGWVV